MAILTYIFRCILMFLFTWFGLRIIGKKSLAQMTSYDLAAVLLLTTTAAEPLVYKITGKAGVGVIVIAILSLLVGKLSLTKLFYNADHKPSLVIINGKIDKKELRRNNLNLPFLFSMMRDKGYGKVSEIEFGIIEPTGNLSVIPKSQERALKPKDMKIETQYEGLALPIIIDGEIQYTNLKYANLNVDWLKKELSNFGQVPPEDIFLAELDTEGKLYVDFYNEDFGDTPSIY